MILASGLNISQYPQSDVGYWEMESGNPDSPGSSTSADIKACYKQENLFQTGNNFYIILLSSLVNSLVNRGGTLSAIWKGSSSSKAARKLQLVKCRLLLTRQYTGQSYSVNFIFANSYNNPALILQAVNQWRSISLMTKCWNAKAKSWASENSSWMKLVFLFPLSCGSDGFNFTYLPCPFFV